MDLRQFILAYKAFFDKQWPGVLYVGPEYHNDLVSPGATYPMRLVHLAKVNCRRQGRAAGATHQFRLVVQVPNEFSMEAASFLDWLTAVYTRPKGDPLEAPIPGILENIKVYKASEDSSRHQISVYHLEWTVDLDDTDFETPPEFGFITKITMNVNLDGYTGSDTTWSVGADDEN